MSYGQELILDLCQCDVSLFTRESIAQYFADVCERIGMVRADLHFWDYEDASQEEIEKAQKNPHVFGISAVQFILTSSIVIHTLPGLGLCFVNIFSCKRFNACMAVNFTAGWFNGEIDGSTSIERGVSCDPTQ